MRRMPASDMARETATTDSSTMHRGIGSAVLEFAGPLAALALILAAFMVFVPTFRSPENFQNISRQIAVVAILAAGETLVIVTAGIDLSVGAMIALTSVLAALTMKATMAGPNGEAARLVLFGAQLHPATVVPVGMLVGIGVGAVVGVVSGSITEYVGIPSFIVTLGMMGICSGTAKLASGGVSVGGLPDAIDWIGAKDVGGVIPVAALVTIAVVVLGQVMLARSAFGRALYAIGGNREAARLSGIPVKRVSVLAFTLCGALAGLAGMVAMSRVGSAQPTGGEGYELYAVAASVIGGTSLMGGEGSISGALIGALIMGVVRTGLDHIGLSDFLQTVVIGAMIIIAVIVDKVRRSMHEHA